MGTIVIYDVTKKVSKSRSIILQTNQKLCKRAIFTKLELCYLLRILDTKGHIGGISSINKLKYSPEENLKNKNSRQESIVR